MNKCNNYMIPQAYELIDTAAFVNIQCNLQHPEPDPLDPNKSVYTGIIEQEVAVGDRIERMTVYIPENYVPVGELIMVFPENGVSGTEFLRTSSYVKCADQNGFILAVLEAPKKGWQPGDIQYSIQYADAAYFKANLREYYGFQESGFSCLGIGAGAYPAMAYSMFRSERIASCAAVGKIGLHPQLFEQLKRLYANKLLENPSNQPLSVLLSDAGPEDKELIAFLKSFYDPETFRNDRGYKVYFPKARTEHSWIGYQPCETFCIAESADAKSVCEFLTAFKRFFSDSMGRLLLTRTPRDMGLIRYEKTVNGKLRHWYVYEPTSYRKGRGKQYPVVMAIPGYSCNAHYLAQISDWHVVGEKRDFFVIYPCAFPGCTPGGCAPLPMWKSGKMYQHDRKDNEEFLKNIIGDMCNRYPLDTSRLYITGHSNGSKMTQELLYDCPGLFAAAAPIGFVCGELGTNVLDDMPNEICPVWYIKGEHDIGIACDMSPDLANQKMIDILCEVNKASLNPVIYHNGKYRNRIYYNDEKMPMVKFTEVTDMPHAQTPEMSLMIWDEYFSRFQRLQDGSVSYIW